MRGWLRRLLTLASVLVVAAPLAACEGDLPKATEIARMRVLGARFEVEGDPERATPEPGERVRVSLPTVFPSLDEDTDDVQMLLIGCTAPTRFTGGLPICQELIDAAASGVDPTDSLPMIDEKLRCADLPLRTVRRGAISLHCVKGEPQVELTVPDDFDAEGLLVRGVVCEHGTPFIDPEDPRLFGCEDEGAEAILVHGTMRVQQSRADENQNPDPDALEVLREGVAWPAYDPDALPPEEGCARRASADFSEPVHLVVTGEHAITLRYDADAREEVDGAPEDLEISVYTTAGEMERRFTLFRGSDRGTDGVLESELFWDPPSAGELPRSGQLARFFITIRDQRGGFAMTSRAVCVR